MHNTRAIAALALLAGGTFLLAACSSGASSNTSSSGNAAAALPSAGHAAGNAVGNSAAGNSAGSTNTSARVAAGSAIEYTAELAIRVPDITGSADTAVDIAEKSGGYVSNETTSSASQTAANLQLKVPVAVYPAVLSQLAALGTRLSLNQQAQDVTEQVADVNSQVTSDQAAIVQLRSLLSHAGSVGDLLTVQNQINSEESDLESIESEQRALSGETSYATVNMTIVGPKPKPPVVHHTKPKPPPSLAGGLAGGWRALRITTDWTLALLGAVGPFLAVAAVAAFAAYRGRRWLLRKRATA